MGSGGDVSTTTLSPHCASVQRHARRGRTGRPGRRTSTTTIAVVCMSLFMSLSRSLAVEADSTRRNELTASKAPATATVSSSPSSSDFVAVYYNLYKHRTSSAVSSISSPVVFKQSVPSEINDRLGRYSLQFTDLPELLKRALLWESGYSIGDNASLVQIHTLCGLSMAQIALSEDEFKASACDTTSCTGSPAGWSYSKACRSDQLLPVTKCASTAIDTVSSTPLWSSKALPSNTSEVTVVPNIQARRHKWPNQDASTPPVHVYAIHSVLPDEEGQETSDICEVLATTTSTAVVIPCSPYIRTDTRWCRPAQSKLMTTWLKEYTQKLQLDHDDLKTGNDISAASSAANASTQGGALDVESNVAVGTSESSKDAHGVYVSAGYKYDGSSSDFTQQFYRRYLASSDSNGGRESGVADKLILHDSLPKEIEQRLSDASLQFDDLPALLQRALVWDSGYAFDESSSSLTAVYVKCGLAMGDIAVSRETSMGISSSSCTVHNCSTSGNASEPSLYQALTCSDDQIKSKSLCAVVGGTQSNSSSTSSPSSSSRLSPMWADGGEESAIPELSVQKHAWENDNENYVMYSIHALSSSDGTSASSSLSQCPAKPSMVIPCIPYSPSTGSDSAKPTTEEWCRPEPGALVTSWLRQVAKEKQFSLLYLIPILISVALGVTGVAIYIRRKTFKRFELKTDSNDGTACRGNTIASTPDGTYASGPFSFLNRSSVVMVDARLSAISSSSSIESFAAFNSNNVLNTLVNHPSLRLNTVVFDQIQFVNLLSEVSSSSSSCSRNEVWLASVRGTHVAVKRLSRAKTAEYEELEEFMGEITLNAALDHPNIAKFIGVAWTTLQNLCMLMEYVDNGDLQLYLKQHCLQLAWEKAKMRIAMGIASAICHLHHQQQPSVAHRDLKSKNVLLTTELDPKLINTGVGRSRLSELVTAASGSEENQVMERSYWTAPEVLHGEAHSEKSDMFAFGVLLSELDTHQLPYEGLKCMATGNDLPPLEILEKVVSGELKPAISPFCPLEIAELIDACLDLDPQKRPSASEAMIVLAKVPITNVGVKTDARFSVFASAQRRVGPDPNNNSKHNSKSTDDQKKSKQEAARSHELSQEHTPPIRIRSLDQSATRPPVMLRKSSTSASSSVLTPSRLSSYWRAHVLPAIALRLQQQLGMLPLELSGVVPHPWGVLALLLRSPSKLLDGLTSAHHRYVDRVTATVTQNPVLFPNGFFCDGWGDINTPQRVRELLQSKRMSEVNELAPQDLSWSNKQLLRGARACIQEGTFKSTLPNAKAFLPNASLDAYCELVTPLEWETTTPPQSRAAPVHGSPSRPLVVLLPGTGEHGFVHRRTSIGIPLARKGVATLILEGPFYGRRKPSDQKGSKLRRVSDLPVLGQATIEEAKSLLAYFQKNHGYSHIVIAGSSMGGLHAAMVASVFPGEVGTTAWLAPPSAVPVFADGLLSASCNWNSLYKQHELQMLDKMLMGHGVAASSEVEQESHFVDEDPVQQAKKRMRMFLSITDIDNFHPPRRADAVVFVVGTEDEYIGVTEAQWQRMRAKWKPAQFRYLKTGHVTGILLEQEGFRKTILEVIDTLRTKKAVAAK